MKKLYKISYRYINLNYPDEIHHNTQYYFCYELKSAINDIQRKYEPLQVDVMSYEELNYTDIL